ncbi:MAG: DUF4190 domain-containing protein [Verrucomicrobiaceae bacterium]|nr:MAG: DUF4190 domain-containing protein [Verrucomicrobiaceae bacterium]
MADVTNPDWKCPLTYWGNCGDGWADFSDTCIYIPDYPMPEIQVSRDGSIWGPWPLSEVNTMLAEGQLMPSDLAWTEGLAGWVPLASMEGVIVTARNSFPPAAAPPLPVMAAPAAPRVMRPQAGYAVPQSHNRGRPPAITSNATVVSLIAGILGLLTFWFPPVGFVLGLVAVICGHVGRSNVKQSRGTLTGKGLGLAGCLLGYLACIVPLITLAAVFGMGFGMVRKAVEEASVRKTATYETVLSQRAAFRTSLIRRDKEDEPAGQPGNPAFTAVEYPSGPGNMAAYISASALKSGGVKLPAILWLVGGFENSISPSLLEPGTPDNDQSASAFHDPGLVLMYPSLRGGNQNPGQKEGLYGEVDDVLAAIKWLKARPGVDPVRIYLGGHSTGGTLALLVAEASPDLRAVFSFGPVADVSDYGQDNLPYRVTDRKESTMRSPGSWLAAISCPAFVMEGTAGNIESLNEMKLRNRNSQIVFLPLEGEDHFSGLRKTSKILAELILADNGPNVNLRVEQRLLQVLDQR